MTGLYVLLGSLFGGFVVTLTQEIFKRRKTEAESDELSAKAVDIITKTAVDLVERTSAMAEAKEAKLEQKITNLEGRVDHLTEVVNVLVKQLEAQGIKPAILPKL